MDVSPSASSGLVRKVFLSERIDSELRKHDPKKIKN